MQTIEDMKIDVNDERQSEIQMRLRPGKTI